MNGREADICARLKEFRESERWTVSAMADKLQITADKLVSVEHGRTPLRFGLAKRMSERFGLNLRWLVDGVGDRKGHVPLPEELDRSIGNDCLISLAFDVTLRAHMQSYGQVVEDIDELRSDLALLAQDKPPALPPGRTTKGFTHFIVLRKEWIPAQRRRAKHLRLLGDKLAQKAADIETAIKESEDIHRREESRKQAAPKASLVSEPKSSAHDKDILDTKPEAGIVGGMKVPTWPQLRKLIAEQTGEHGAKAALADKLGVSRQVLNNWLASGEQGAPNAETTLKLLAMFWKPAK